MGRIFRKFRTSFRNLKYLISISNYPFGICFPSHNNDYNFLRTINLFMSRYISKHEFQKQPFILHSFQFIFFYYAFLISNAWGKIIFHIKLHFNNQIRKTKYTAIFLNNRLVRGGREQSNISMLARNILDARRIDKTRISFY